MSKVNYFHIKAEIELFFIQQGKLEKDKIYISIIMQGTSINTRRMTLFENIK